MTLEHTDYENHDKLIIAQSVSDWSDLSHFKRREFVRSQTAIRLGIDNTPSPIIEHRLLAVATYINSFRSFLGMPIDVNSAFRCPALNTAIGGSASSWHCLGYAVDIECKQMSNAELMLRFWDYATDSQVMANGGEMPIDNIIAEYINEDNPTDGWVHISFGPRQRRQMMRVNHGTGYEKIDRAWLLELMK